jgi:hypothetical protein
MILAYYINFKSLVTETVYKKPKTMDERGRRNKESKKQENQKK